MAALDAYGIKYLVVGAVAFGVHAEPRLTKDMDVLVHVDAANVDALYAALRDYGAPLHIVQKEEFLAEDFVFFFGAPPWRIDILTSIPGVDFDQAYADRVVSELGGKRFNVLSKTWLIRAKRASGRPQDLSDLHILESFT